MATIFRPPIIVTVYSKPKARDEWAVNLSVLYSPNPASPFAQLDWPSAVRARAKATGEATSAPYSLYTPNPSGPFNQEDWLNAALARQAQKSDAPTYFIPPKPFTEVAWPGIQRGLPAAKVDDVVNLYQAPVAIDYPFSQTDWGAVALPRKAIPADTVTLLLPFFGTAPFAGLTETRTMARQSVKSDIFVNLLPLQSAPIVLPFSQGDWFSIAQRRFAANVDLIERSYPLYTPNPEFPFIDPIMANLNASQKQTAAVDAVMNLLPVQNPTPPPIVGISEWLIRARRRGRR